MDVSLDVLFYLKGDYALLFLDQTCGVKLERKPVSQVLYTHVAGASCEIIPQREIANRCFRLWFGVYDKKRGRTQTDPPQILVPPHHIREPPQTTTVYEVSADRPKGAYLRLQI